MVNLLNNLSIKNYQFIQIQNLKQVAEEVAYNMPKFPSPEENRFSPYRKSISTPINKSLLTPCRRIGLSRKKNSTPSPSTPLNTSITLAVTDNETPKSKPMKLEHSFAEVNKELIKNHTSKVLTKSEANHVKSLKAKEIQKSKNGQSLEEKSGLQESRLKSESLDKEPKEKFKKNPTESKVDQAKNTKINPVDSKAPLKEQLEKNCIFKNEALATGDPVKEESRDLQRTPKKFSKVVNDKSENTSDELIEVKLKPGFTKSLFKNSSSDEEISSSLESISVTQNNCKLDHGYEKCQEKKLTQWRRTLSLKKMPGKEPGGDSSKSKRNDESLLTEFKVKPCSVSLQKLASTEFHESTEELQELEEIVAGKRKLLQNLKQADIYRKLHNLNDLERLTSVWKKGCISGLEDLLVQLRTHAEIDMGTLLTNLRIPTEYISLSADGILE